MGYSNKLDPRLKEYLNQLMASDSVIEWQSSDPAKFAYKLREALHANGDEKLKAKFIIKVLPNKVRATPRFVGATILPISGDESPQNPEEKEIIKEKLSKMVLADVSDLYGIVGAVIQHAPRSQSQSRVGNEFYFPNANVQDEDMHKLWLWASSNGYYVVKGEGITITTNDPGLIAWKPI